MIGVLLTPLKRVPTSRGDVFHAMKSSDPGYAGFGEAYFSSILPGIVKGWKRHRRMTLNLVVPVGRIRIVLHDQASGQFQDAILSPQSDETYQRLTVPPGLLMAFRGESDGVSMMLNLASMPHDPDETDSLPLESVPWQW